MTEHHLEQQAERILTRLCVEIGARHVGSAGNRASSEFFAATAASFGWRTECLPFDCMDWTEDGAELEAGEERFAVRPSPYSLGCRVRGPLSAASTVEELEGAPLAGRVLLLRGEITREQLMPKNFEFYNPDEHRRIIRALEAAQPLAIVAATSRNPELAGALYPFPLIEDGDFDIPSVYTTDGEGERLAAQVGREVRLASRAQRSAAVGYNVLARRGGEGGRRAVLFAHIDAKQGTPGAIDNATGVAVLLLVAELLADLGGALNVELVAMNGEDYYAAPGEVQWLRLNEGRFDDIALGINVDGVGHRGGRPAFSLYGCSDELAALIRDALNGHPVLVEGSPWYQSDHSLFVMKGIPALALTSQQFSTLWSEVAHTAADRPEIVDPAQVVAVALAVRDVLSRMEGLGER